MSEVASLNWVVYKIFVRLSMELNIKVFFFFGGNIKVIVTVIAVSFLLAFITCTDDTVSVLQKKQK